MEDALCLSDALEAAIRYRIVKCEEALLIEPGESDDHLFDLETGDRIYSQG